MSALWSSRTNGFRKSVSPAVIYESTEDVNLLTEELDWEVIDISQINDENANGNENAEMSSTEEENPKPKHDIVFCPAVSNKKIQKKK